MKKILLIIISLLSIILISCGEQKYLKGITEKTIEVGKSEKVEIETNISNPSLSYFLSTDCLEVDSKGTITAVKPGMCEVTITEEKTNMKAVIKYQVIKLTEKLEVEDTVVLKLDETKIININLDSESSFKLSIEFEEAFIDASLNEKDLTIKAKKLGTTKIKLKEEYSSLEKEIRVMIENPKLEALVLEELTVGEVKNIQVNRKIDEIDIISSNNIFVDGLTFKGLETGEGFIKIIDKSTKEEIEFSFNIISYIKDFTLQASDIKETLESKIEITYDQNCKVLFEVINSSNNLEINGLTYKAITAGEAEITVREHYSGIEKTIKFMILKLNDLSQDIKWAMEKVGTSGRDECILPEKNPNTKTTYTWQSSDESVFALDGFLDYVEFDTEVILTVTATNGNDTQTESFTFTVLGYAVEDLAEEFESQFKGNRIVKSMTLITKYNGYYGNSYITWQSSDEQIFNNSGEFTKPLKDCNITIYYTVHLDEPQIEKSYEIELDVMGMTISDIVEPVTNWVKSNVGENGMIDENTIFPDYYEDYETQLVWLDEYGNPLKIDKYVGNPIFSQGIDVIVKLIFGKYTGQIDLHYNFALNDLENMWDKIELFVNTIAGIPVKTYKYTLITWRSDEYGYIPFYSTDNAQINKNILPYTYGKQRTNIKKTSTEYIVVHDTGNPNKSATAQMHNTYITNLNNNPDSSYISWHFTVGEDEIYQHLPLDEVAYHAGDGSYVYGDTYFNSSYNAWSIGGGNRNGIGIESCVNEGCDYTEVMRKLAKLVSELLIEFNLSIDRVKQHNNFSGKNCPQVMRENNRWKEFITLVQLEYFAKTQLQGVSFTWESTTDKLNNHGKVTQKCEPGTKLTYKVKVNYQGTEKEFNFESVVEER